MKTEKLDITEDFFQYMKNKVANYIIVENDNDVPGISKSRKLKTNIIVDEYKNNNDYKERTLSNIYYELLMEFVDRYYGKYKNIGGIFPESYLIYIKEIFQPELIYNNSDFSADSRVLISYKFIEK